MINNKNKDRSRNPKGDTTKKSYNYQKKKWNSILTFDAALGTKPFRR